MLSKLIPIGLLAFALPVIADNAYMAPITTAPSNVAGSIEYEQAVGDVRMRDTRRIVSVPKLWALSETDAIFEAQELPKPAPQKAKKQASTHTKIVVTPPSREKTDCPICDAQREMLLGKIKSKVETTTAQVDSSGAK